MPKFRMSPLQANNILELYQQRHRINLDPPYQRLSVWDDEKKARFIDSIINEMDTPKIYFHDVRGRSNADEPFRSVIDGKATLLALFEFIENRLRLPGDFKYFDNESYSAGGLTYDQLLDRHPLLRDHFENYYVPVVVVEADEDEWVEELFWRLNVQMPLSAPARRNALGGPLPLVIRKIGLHPFFKETSRIRMNRFQHLDLAAKFLYICHLGGVGEVKKATLDNFVKAVKSARVNGERVGSTGYLDDLEKRVAGILDLEHQFFGERNELLANVGRNTLYFHAFRMCDALGTHIPFSLAMLQRFNRDVGAARKKARRMANGSGESLESWESDLRSFDSERQSPNDKTAIERQYKYLANYMTDKFDVVLLELR